MNVPLPMYERQTSARSYISMCQYMTGVADEYVQLYAPIDFALLIILHAKKFNMP